MPARRKKVKGNWLFSLFWNSYVTSVYFAIEYGYNSCKHYLWYLSSLIQKCFWIFPPSCWYIAPNATTSYSEIRGWFFAQWNFQVKIHQKLSYFWRIMGLWWKIHSLKKILKNWLYENKITSFICGLAFSASFPCCA